MTVILVGHGSLPQGMLAAAELILGPQEQVHALGLEPGDSPEVLAGRLESLVAGAERGVLVLADLFGGSPANAAARVLMGGSRGVQVVAGLNLPMLLEVLMARLQGVADAAELARRAAEAGRDGVRDMRPIFGG
ncbi:PTS sugar transporter subunit IIA [Thermaerobacter sp. PB12/4term]|uniref:PTS sugar transporter subunit IIA n=1 Tax=Thermaerobacter sp. PB12/4term TaxID=2293838 RepID=UPI0019401BAD|nr:PTS sugar transporter subunit IIA [Thermaerobacter sp. PB12/4term]